jgi:hypothetical protein
MSTQLLIPQCADFDREIDREFERLVHNDAGPVPMCEEQKMILRIINRHRGAERPIPLSALCDEVSRMLSRQKGKSIEISRRRVEDYVASLVNIFHVRIGSSRGKNHGYYWIRTPEELDRTTQIYVGEIQQLARRVRALCGKEYVAELFGQMQITFTNSDLPTGDTEARRLNG